MADIYTLPNAVQWHEGMLLAPQHFQQSTLRQEELLHYHTMLTAPFHWGIRVFEIDQALLVNGLFRVEALEAVMPDGLVVSHTGEDGETLELDLTEYVEENPQAELTVHLGVTVKGLDQVATNGELARYDSLEEQAVADTNTGEGALQIPRLKPHIRLLVAETPPARYTAFPLAKVVYEDQRFQLTHFVPPTLAVTILSDLGETCAQLAKRLREKATFLSNKVQSSAGTLELPLVLETKGMVQSLVSALPYLEGVLYTGASHPYALYLALCSVIGQVAAFSPGMVPPAPTPYNHNDLRLTFDQMSQFVFKMLDEGILEAYTAVPFHFESGTFKLTFRDAWMSSQLVLGVRRHSEQSEQDLVAWMEGCLIGSENRIETMRENRVLGAARQQIGDDDELVAARGMVFFSLAADSRFIESNEVLQVFNSEDPSGARRPAELVLYIKNLT